VTKKKVSKHSKQADYNPSEERSDVSDFLIG
jgi:hypothetical protein